MEILVSNEQDIKVDENLLERVAFHTLEQEVVPQNAELSIALVDELEIRRLNSMYRGKDAPTDVLSFESGEDDESTFGVSEMPYLLGDVIICPAVALKQAEEYGQSFEQEIALLLVHGILHILGYDHSNDEDATAMELRERDILASLQAS
jgi:probable rRNA maturation factor